MPNVLNTKSVTNSILKKVLSNPEFTLHTAARVGKMENIAVRECSFHNIQEASTTVASTNLSNNHPPPCLTKPLKVPSDSESQEGNHVSLHRRCSLCRHNRRKSRYQEDAIRSSLPILTNLTSAEAYAAANRSICTTMKLAIHRNSPKLSSHSSTHTTYCLD